MPVRTPDKPLTYLPMNRTSDHPCWVTYPSAPGNNWSASKLDASGYTSAAVPAPPRPPRLAALLNRANDLGLSSSYYEKDGRASGEVRHFSCWRLRAASFCLLIAVALQASVVGSRLQALTAPGANAELFVASSLLALLLIALWSLLSQLLLWSDSAVLKIPTGVHVSHADSRYDEPI